MTYGSCSNSHASRRRQLGIGAPLRIAMQLASEFAMSTVLVVDDEPNIAHAIEAVLHEHCHRVLFAVNAEQAFRLACTWLPDIIVTDRDMPGMDGIALCKKLDRYPASGQVPVIMISGREWPASQPAPWTMYLRKPVNPVVLEAAAESLVAQRYWRDPGPPSLPDRATSRWAPAHTKEWI